MKTIYPIKIKFNLGKYYLTANEILDKGEVVQIVFSQHNVARYIQILWKIGFHKGYVYRVEYIYDNLTLIEKLAAYKGLI